MARKPNPALLGAFVVGAVILAVLGLVIFGGGKFFRSTQSWVAYFDESIKGLAVGAPVTFRGVKVGSVTDVKVVVDPKSGRSAPRSSSSSRPIGSPPSGRKRTVSRRIARARAAWSSAVCARNWKPRAS
jgi:MlaD protein